MSSYSAHGDFLFSCRGGPLAVCVVGCGCGRCGLVAAEAQAGGFLLSGHELLDEEFWSSFLKLSAIVTFIIIGIVLVCGGGPEGGRYDEYWGDRLLREEGFKNGFKGFCSVFVTAAFAFAGTELIGLAASESATPLQTLPSACKQVFWRVTLFVNPHINPQAAG